MSKRKVYVVPEVRIVKVCQENLMTNPTSWNPGSGPNQLIIESNPGGESDNYDDGIDYNAWEDDM